MTGEAFSWGVIAIAAWVGKLTPLIFLGIVTVAAYYFGRRRK